MGAVRRGRLVVAGVTAALAAIATAGYTAGTATAAPVARAETGRVTAAAAYKPPARTLREGMSGSDVRALQRRLAALKYYPGPVNGVFGSDTLEAVWALQEVNRLSVTGVVARATKQALVNPRTYKAHDPRQDGTRVEINLGMRVLVFYKNRQIALISHISSGGHYYYCGIGCYAETPTGEFRALYFVPGWDEGPLGAMYNPTFFNYDGYAIHGEYNDEVPLNNVSHGCVRIPMDIATWFYKDLRISETPGRGTEIWIYNQW